MSDESCATCPDPKEDDNHLTGRGAYGAQLDDAVTAPACHECHEVFHEELRLLEIDKPLQRDDVLDRLERRMRRMAVFFGQLFARFGWPWIRRIADAFARWAEELRDRIERLDRWNPDWRFA